MYYSFITYIYYNSTNYVYIRSEIGFNVLTETMTSPPDYEGVGWYIIDSDIEYMESSDLPIIITGAKYGPEQGTQAQFNAIEELISQYVEPVEE